MNDNYRKVTEICTRRSTATSIRNSLNKARTTTEDPDLVKLLNEVVSHIDRRLNVMQPKQKNEKIRLILNQEPMKGLFDYCQECIKSQKPEWKIIAEKKGWKPSQ